MIGDGEYTVMAADRGGVTRIGEITGVTRLSWNRVQDATSIATMVVTEPDSRCCQLLSDLRCVRHEIIIYRNGRRVWEGPITRLAYKPGEVEIDARDITWFLSRRVLEVGWNYMGTAYPAVAAVYKTIHDHYPPVGDPYNIGPYLTRVIGPDEPNTAAVYYAHSRTVFNLLEQYASRGGMDYTVVGRRLILNDTNTRAHVLPRMTDEHLSGSVNVTEYGMELKTRVFTSNSETKYAQSLAPQEWLDYYGPVDFVNNNVEEGDGDPDEEDLEAIQEVTTRILLTGYPTPVRVWIPDQARLDPCYPVEFDDLVGGAWVPLQSQDTCRKISQWQKLRSLDIDWTPDGERIGVTLTKAPSKMVEPTSVVSPSLPDAG
jgi:hypothetical protein